MSLEGLEEPLEREGPARGVRETVRHQKKKKGIGAHLDTTFLAGGEREETELVKSSGGSQGLASC